MKLENKVAKLLVEVVYWCRNLFKISKKRGTKIVIAEMDIEKVETIFKKIIVMEVMQLLLTPASHDYVYAF